jgi:acetyl-CoA acetyltransferase
MSDRTAPPSAALVGYGETAVGSHPDRGVEDLCAEAAGAALSDAGMTGADVDGLVARTPSTEDLGGSTVPVVADAVGVAPIRWGVDVGTGGAAYVQALADAGAAIEAGLADVVLVVAADRLRAARAQEVDDDLLGTAAGPFEEPANTVASLYAHVANWHVKTFGTTRDQLAKVSEIASTHAAKQRPERAHVNEASTVEEVLASPMIADPLTQYQCSLVSDGGAAFVVTDEATARDLGEPYAALTGFDAEHTHAHLSGMADFAETGAAAAGDRAMAAADVEHDDLDVVEIYDCFSISVLRFLEDLGFCERGESGDLVESGALELGGRWPMNTHGGALAGAHPGPAGIFHVTEAIRQLTGAADGTQVEGAETALVHGNGGVFSTQAVAILEGRAAR